MTKINGYELEEVIIPDRLKKLLYGDEFYSLEKVKGKDREFLLRRASKKEIILYVKDILESYFRSVSDEEGKIEGLSNSENRYAIERALEEIAKKPCPQFIPMSGYNLVLKKTV